MKKTKVLLMFIAFIIILTLTACSNINTGGTGSLTARLTDNVTGNNTDITIKDDDVNEEFTLLNDSGQKISSVDNVYTITEGGSYTAQGKLENGQIYINASNLDVEITLLGVSITNSSVSPIYALDCSSLTIKVKNETDNYIYDNRTTDYSNTTDETVGLAAIYVKNGNLKINGKGSLSVTSLYNSGIMSKDNVVIKNATLLIKAMNNGIKGNDKVTIEENPTIGIVCGNNGIRTSNSDSGSSAQHGYIYINGGSISINSYGDAIDAEYAVEIGTSTDSDGNIYTPTIDIYTNIYSSYTLNTSSNVSTTSTSEITYLGFGGPGGMGPGGNGGFMGGKSAEKADDSAKGIKANEYINITAGKIFIYAYDDGLHTNINTLETGVKSSGNITISGGDITIKASDDGIHADGTLTITNGDIYIPVSHEGLEGKNIVISGGNITVTADDDGINVSNQITISGGRVDVTVSPNGDTDGIDSNNAITITGGIIITRGPNNQNASPIDAEKSFNMTGGTLIAIGYLSRNISYSGLSLSKSTTGLSSGAHSVTIGSTVIEYSNSYTYYGNVYVIASSSATIK